MILGLFVVVGVIGTLVPALPGCGIILAGVLIHAVLTEFQPFGLWPILGYTGLFVISWIGQFVVTGLGTRKFGSTKYGAIGACVGMFVGLFLPFFGGMLVGTFIGAFVFEIFFAMKEPMDGARAGFGALVGTVFSLFYEFLIALVMAGFIGWQIF